MGAILGSFAFSLRFVFFSIILSRKFFAFTCYMCTMHKAVTDLGHYTALHSAGGDRRFGSPGGSPGVGGKPAVPGFPRRDVGCRSILRM